MLDWYATSYGEVFPGCPECCVVTLSPMVHTALESYRLDSDEAGDMPVFKEVVTEYHHNDHSFNHHPTPALIPKKRKAIANATST